MKDADEKFNYFLVEMEFQMEIFFHSFSPPFHIHLNTLLAIMIVFVVICQSEVHGKEEKKNQLS